MTQPEPYFFLLYALAVFRLSLLVSKEDGPAWIFRKLRRAVPKDSSAKIGIQCQWCVSMWMSLPVSLYAFHRQIVPEWLGYLGDWFILMLALSTVAIAINQTFTKS